MTVRLGKLGSYVEKNCWSEDLHPEAFSFKLSDVLGLLEDGRLKYIPKLSEVFNSRVKRYLQAAGVVDPSRPGGCSRCRRKTAGYMLVHAARTGLTVVRRYQEADRLEELWAPVRNLLTIPLETRIVVPYRSPNGEVRFLG